MSKENGPKGFTEARNENLTSAIRGIATVAILGGIGMLIASALSSNLKIGIEGLLAVAGGKFLLNIPPKASPN